MKKTLIIGGTSGLGLALAKREYSSNKEVFITGRHNPDVYGLRYLHFEITADGSELEDGIDKIISQIGEIDSLIYSVGYNQVADLETLSANDVFGMINACLVGGIEFTRKIIISQSNLNQLTLISSTSSIIPREKESIYAAAKAGLSHFGRSVSLSGKIQKTLVVSPAGMQTKMQQERGVNDESLLRPDMVAEKILEQLEDTSVFREVLILRDPFRVEVVKS